MAILKGFPPSNTISPDAPSKFTCELCGKEFWQSFPLSLQLSIDGNVNFSILPCRECFELDQGNKYWSNEPNKWGDHFTIYSKVRKGYSYWEIYWRKTWNRGQWKRFGSMRWNDQESLTDSWSEKLESLYVQIINYLKNPWSDWNRIYDKEAPRSKEWFENWYKEEIWLNTPMVIRTNETICELFGNFSGFKRSQTQPYYGTFNTWRPWYILYDPVIPNYPCTKLFFEETPSHQQSESHD